MGPGGSPRRGTGAPESSSVPDSPPAAARPRYGAPVETGFQIGGDSAERYERFVAPIMLPFVGTVLDAARLGPGDALADVACGTGFVARAAAGRIGPAGRLVGVDVNPRMLAVARERSAGTEPTIAWFEAPAERLPLDGDSFDAVVCQQGVQFFPDPEAALVEMARVARPGGRVVATVWAALDRSAFMAAQFEAVRDIIGPDGSASFLDAFAFSADRLRQAFRAAGLGGVEVAETTAAVRIPSASAFFAGQLSALPWGALVAAARPDGLAAAAEIMGRRLAADIDADGTLDASFSALLAVARK